MLAWLVIGLYGCALLVIFVYAVLQGSLAVNYLRAKRKQPAQSTGLPSRYPPITIQLPVYNEKYVVERLLRETVKLNWPREKIEFQVLDDSQDETSAIIDRVAGELVGQGYDIAVVRRPSREGFKAGALKYGMQSAKGEFIAIFDADFLPDPDFLNKTVPLFGDEKVGSVQTRWEHLNRDFSMLTRLQAFALDAHFSVEQTGRNTRGHFINFNGTGGIWRRKTIENSGGWQADTLTEDLDLSYRAQMKGWKFIYREDIGSPAELPVAISAVKSQQFRWTKGGAETFKKLAGELVQTPGLRFSDRMHGLAHLFNSSVFVFVFLLSLSSVPLVYLVASDKVISAWVDYSAVFFVSTLFLAFYYGVSYREKFDHLYQKIFYFPLRFIQFLVIMMGLSYANTRAVLLGYMGRKTAFVRTPKFNLERNGDTYWKRNVYLNSGLNLVNLVELLLALYFMAAIVLGIRSSVYGMIPFHALLSIGFLSVFFLAISEKRRD